MFDKATFNCGSGQIVYFYLNVGAPEDVVILHGFPDSPENWLNVASLVSSRGFNAYIPYLPGYYPSVFNGSDSDFGFPMATNLVRQFIEEAFTNRQVILVGHDWGALLAYNLSTLIPIKHLITLSVPPQSVMSMAFTNFHQIRRSWYMFFFLWELSDIIIQANDLSFIEHLFSSWGIEHDYSSAISNAKKSLRDPSSLRHALLYYRSLLNPETILAANFPQLSQKLLYVHGKMDGCIGLDVVSQVESFFPKGSRACFIENAGHFLNLDAPSELVSEIIKFIEETPTSKFPTGNSNNRE